jgi:bifunctional non-homologous end joining protein LigD
LLLGVYDDSGDLLSVGSVGTGWSFAEATELKTKLAKLAIAKTAFSAGADKPGRWTRRIGGSERWVSPRLVAEVEFAEWTPDGHIRHASYVSLRSDKPAKAIRRESAKTPAGARPVSNGATE